MAVDYPVSEVFNSPQGEGVYTGTMMTFIRLAGCSVGKRYPKERYQNIQLKPRSEGLTTLLAENLPPILPIYTEECTLYDGRKFACDTDYRTKQRLNAYQLMKMVGKGISRVCITGGEPLIHDLTPLIDNLQKSGYWVHLETSGTKLIEFHDKHVWVTVSPKMGVLPEMIRRANEIKILVDEGFVWEQLPKDIRDHDKVFVQPVNTENGINGENLKRCVELQKHHPKLRLSIQLHKVLSYHTKELVR